MQMSVYWLPFPELDVTARLVACLFAAALANACSPSVRTGNVGQPPGSPACVAEGNPRLTKREVSRIAETAGSRERINLRNYVCNGMRFYGNGTNQTLTNKWMVGYTPEPATVHGDVFVIVDDATGEAHLIRY